MRSKVWKVGEVESVTTVITPWKNASFGELSGDQNPVHFNSTRMAKTHFGRPIANGIQTLSLIGTALVKMFTTKSTMVIAMQQHNSFLAPVYMDDTITATVEVIPAPVGKDKKGEYWMTCLVNNQDDVCVLSSTFRVRVLHA